MYHYTLQLPLVAIQQALIVFNNTGDLSFLIYLQTERYSEMQTTILVLNRNTQKKCPTKTTTHSEALRQPGLVTRSKLHKPVVASQHLHF